MKVGHTESPVPGALMFPPGRHQACVTQHMLASRFLFVSFACDDQLMDKIDSVGSGYRGLSL